jgi:hypothetical protein
MTYSSKSLKYRRKPGRGMRRGKRGLKVSLVHIELKYKEEIARRRQYPISLEKRLGL